MDASCPTPQKASHDTEAEARGSAAWVRSNRGTLCDVYECACGKWHLSRTLSSESIHRLIWEARGTPGGPVLDAVSGEVIGWDEGAERLLDDIWLTRHGYTTGHKRDMLVKHDRRFTKSTTGEIRCAQTGDAARAARASTSYRAKNRDAA